MAVEELKCLRVLLYLISFVIVSPFITCEDLNNPAKYMNATITCGYEDYFSTQNSESCLQSITYDEPRHKLVDFLSPPDNNGLILVQPLIHFNANEEHCLTHISIKIMIYENLKAQTNYGNRIAVNLLSRNSNELQSGLQEIDSKGLNTTCSNFATVLKITVSSLKKCSGSEVDKSFPNNTNDRITVNPVAEFLHNKESSKDYPMLSLTKNALKIDWGDMAKFGCDKVEDEYAVTGSLSFTIKRPGEDPIFNTSDLNLDLFKSQSLEFNDTKLDNPVYLYCNSLLSTITVSDLKFGSTDTHERETIVFKDRKVKPKDLSSTFNGQIKYKSLREEGTEENNGKKYMDRQLYLHFEAESELGFICFQENATVQDVTTGRENSESILSQDGKKEINVTAYRGCQTRQIHVVIRKMITNDVILNQTYSIPAFNISKEFITGSETVNNLTKEAYFKINANDDYNLKCMKKQAIVTDISNKQQKNKDIFMVNGSHRVDLTEYIADCTDTFLNILIEDENEEEFLTKNINLARNKPGYVIDEKIDECTLIKNWTPWKDNSSCSATCEGGRKKQQRQCLGYLNNLLDSTKCSGERERTVKCNMDNCRCKSGSQLQATIINDTVPTPKGKKLLPDEGHLPMELDLSKLSKEDYKNMVNVILGGFAINPKENSPYILCTDEGDGYGCLKLIVQVPSRLGVNFIIPVKANFIEGYNCSYKDLKVEVDERLIYKKWTDWSNCSVECGDGIMTRSRSCLLGQEEYCKELSNMRQEETCDHLEPCKGTYGPWGDWGSCDKGCVNFANIPGKKQRSRTCDACEDRGLLESKDCWGSPEPNFCSPNCSLVAIEETKTKSSHPKRYDMSVMMKRPPAGTWDIISQELLLRDEYSAVQKNWILNETIFNETQYQSDETRSCSSCTEHNQICSCTFENLEMHKSYSLRLIIKEKSSIHHGKEKIVTMDTICADQTVILNDWQCKSGNESIPALGVCNGTPECTDNSDEDETMCKGESKLMQIGLPLLLCLIFDIILVALLFQFSQIEKKSLQMGVEQSNQLEEFWQHIWETNQTSDIKLGMLIENLSESEKVKALDISTALDHSLQELVFNSFVSKLGESEMLELIATKIKNKKKRTLIIDVVQAGCIGRLKIKFLGMFSSSVIIFGMLAMALVGGIFSSINSVYDPFKDIGLILVLYFFIEEIIQGNFYRIDGLNLTYVVRILIICLVLSYLVLTWIRIKKLPTEIIHINTGAKICCVIPGFFYVLNAFISMSISYELYQAQRGLQKLEGKEKIKEIALISHLKDKIYVLQDKIRATASVKAVLEQMIQCSICSTLFLRTKLRAIFLSTVTKAIPNLFEVMTIVSFLTLLLKIRSYKSGCKQSFFSLGGLLQAAAMGMMLIQKVFLYVLFGYQLPLLIVAISIPMIVIIFMGNYFLGHPLFMSIGFADRFIYAVASSLIPITLPEPMELDFVEEKITSKSTNKQEMEMQNHSQKPVISDLNKELNASANSIDLKEIEPSKRKSDEEKMPNLGSSKTVKEIEQLDTKVEDTRHIYQPRSDTGIFIHVVHLIESCLLVMGIILQTHLFVEYRTSIKSLFGNTDYAYTIFLAFLFQAVGVIGMVLFYRYKHAWLAVKGSGEVKEAP